METNLENMARELEGLITRCEEMGLAVAAAHLGTAAELLQKRIQEKSQKSEAQTQKNDG